jgi:hypothetical protein
MRWERTGIHIFSDGDNLAVLRVLGGPEQYPRK